MRVTAQMESNIIKTSLQSVMTELNDANTRLFTGRKINKPSDDVLGAVQSLDYKRTLTENEKYQEIISGAELNFKIGSDSLSSVSDMILNLKSMVNGVGLDDVVRRTQSSSLAANYRDMVLEMSNTKNSGKYIFSGFLTDQQAYTFNTLTNQFDYNGDIGIVNLPVGQNYTVPLNVPGSAAFSGAFTSTAPAQLPDGTPINYAQVTNPVNNVVTTTVTIGNVGDPEYDTFAFSNVMDLANIMSFAWNMQAVDGTDLNASAAVKETMARNRLDALSFPLEEAIKQVQSAVVSIGISQTKAKEQSERLTTLNSTLSQAIGSLQDADMTETAVAIKNAEVTLEAMRTTAAKVLSQSLFDFLR